MQVGHSARGAMGPNQLFERFFRGEITLNAIERWYPFSLRQLQSCVAIDNDAVAYDYDWIAKREVATSLQG